MGFPAILLIAGVLLILIGLLGRVRARDVDVGTENPKIRIAVTSLGAVLLVSALIAFAWEKWPTSPVAPDTNPNISNANRPTPNTPTPTPAAKGVAINSPRADEAVEVDLDAGAAVIPVTGVAEGFSAAESADAQVYVFTSTGGSSEWWYDTAAELDGGREWRTKALSGSREKPAKRGHTVEIRAVLATKDEIRKATGGAKYVRNFNSFAENKKSKTVSITLLPR